MPGSGWNVDEEERVINPYVALQQMQLTPADLVLLAPYLLDDDYLPSFSYWRSFHPSRTLHRVSWVVGRLINETAKQDLAKMEELEDADAESARAHVDRVIAWCKTHAGLDHEELIREGLRAAEDWRRFLWIAEEAVHEDVPGAWSVIAGREGDFSDHADDLARLGWLSGTPMALEQARGWIEHGDDAARMWAALIILRHGDAAEREVALAMLTAVLSADDGDELYPMAVVPLLTLDLPAAEDLAAAILDHDGFQLSFRGREALLALLHAGRPEAIAFLERAMVDGHDAGFANDPEEVVDLVRGFARDGVVVGEDLVGWLRRQVARIRSGETHELREPRPVHPQRWRIDAP